MNTSNKVAQINAGKKKRRTGKKAVKQILFLIVWIYTFVRLFITDIDAKAITCLNILSPSLYITFRFFVLIVLLTILWLWVGNKRFWKNVGLFVLVPFYLIYRSILLIIWEIPKSLLARRFLFLFYLYTDAVVNTILEFKSALLKLLLLIISFLIIFTLNSYWLILPIGILLVLQFTHIWRRYRQTFAPVRIFGMQLGSDKPLPKLELEKVITNTSIKSDSDEQKKFKAIEYLFMLNYFFEKLGIAISDILTNKAYLKLILWKTLFTFFISVVLFAGINYSLFRFDPGHFNIEGTSNFFDFVYYSFFSVFPDGTGITPESGIAKLIRMFGVATGVIINILLLVFYVSVAGDKYKEGLEQVIGYSKANANEAKDFFKNKYGLDFDEMIEKFKASSKNFQALQELMAWIFRKEKKGK